jgi:hypothetical protein
MHKVDRNSVGDILVVGPQGGSCGVASVVLAVDVWLRQVVLVWSKRSLVAQEGFTILVLALKVITKVQKELNVGRQIVEVTATEEQMEEEEWDPTMVAEYGDEIFLSERSSRSGCRLMDTRSLPRVWKRRALRASNTRRRSTTSFSVQGKYVSVCLGLTDLVLPYY